MPVNAIARRYGGALFEQGLAKGNLEEIRKDFEVVVHIFKDFPRIRRVYEDKKIYSKRKQELFGKFFEGILHYTTMTFLDVVVENYREEYLFAMEREFTRLYRRHKGIVEARIITAVELTDANMEAIEGELREATGKEVALQAKVDPRLIGGSILRFGDTVINNSVSFKLQRLEKEMKDITRRERVRPSGEVR